MAEKFSTDKNIQPEKNYKPWNKFNIEGSGQNFGEKFFRLKNILEFKFFFE